MIYVCCYYVSCCDLGCLRVLLEVFGCVYSCVIVWFDVACFLVADGWVCDAGAWLC